MPTNTLMRGMGTKGVLLDDDSSGGVCEEGGVDCTHIKKGQAA